jgi:transposase
MMQREFTEEEKQALHYERFHHPHPRVPQKMEVVWLKSQGLPPHEIARLAGVCENTVRTYLQEYQDGSLERLKQLNFYRPQSELVQHQATLEAAFREQPPATINEAVRRIEQLTGIKRSPTQVRQFLKKMGLRCRKVGCDPPRQTPRCRRSLKKTVRATLGGNPRGEREVWFVDASHFVWGAFVGWLWCFARVWVKGACGRQRLSVLRALNAVTHEVVTVSHPAYITAESVCALLVQLAERAGSGAVTVVLDNARYQRCALAPGVAQELGIELLYLPTYSPNLNLIERFWKFVKKECLYAKLYENFGAFQAAIEECIEKAPTKHKEKLDSWLTLKFQSFQHVKM